MVDTDLLNLCGFPPEEKPDSVCLIDPVFPKVLGHKTISPPPPPPPRRLFQAWYERAEELYSWYVLKGLPLTGYSGPHLLPKQSGDGDRRRSESSLGLASCCLKGGKGGLCFFKALLRWWRCCF